MLMKLKSFFTDYFKSIPQSWCPVFSPLYADVLMEYCEDKNSKENSKENFNKDNRQKGYYSFCSMLTTSMRNRNRMRLPLKTASSNSRMSRFTKAKTAAKTERKLLPKLLPKLRVNRKNNFCFLQNDKIYCCKSFNNCILISLKCA